MTHLKRHKVPKTWPIPRKGTTFVVRTNFDMNSGIPVLIILRDVLKIVNNRKESKKAINQKNILLNNNPIKDEKTAMTLFDVLTIVPMKKNYQLIIAENKKFDVVECKDAKEKISKIINKKVLKGKKVQLNLYDGRNFISDIKCKVNDSVVIDLMNGKISDCLALKEKSNVLVISGKHAGKNGVIDEILEKRKMARIISGKEKINVLIKQLMVVK